MASRFCICQNPLCGGNGGGEGVGDDGGGGCSVGKDGEGSNDFIPVNHTKKKTTGEKTKPTSSNNPRLNLGAKRKARETSRPRTIIGKNVSDGLLSIRGADLTINKYIGRFHMDTTEEALREFITKKDVTVVELDPIKTTHNRFKSFRLRVKRSELDKIEDPEFWPQGVVVCRYFHPRNKEQLGLIGGATDPQETENGA